MFAKDTTKPYRTSNVIDISKISTTAQAIDAFVTKFNATNNSYYTAAKNGNKVTLTSKETGSRMNDANPVYGWSQSYSAGGGGSKVAAVADSAATGKISSATYLSGGQDQIGTPNTGDDHDATYQSAKTASLTLNLSGASAGTGFTIHSPSYYNACVHLVSGNGGLTYVNTSQNYEYMYTLGVNANVSNQYINGMYMSYQNGKLTLTASVLT